MAFFMLFLLIAITFISYIYGKRNLLSPWFLICLMFLATYIILLINYEKWEVDINSTFILYIMTSILAFGFGCIFVQLIRKTNNVSYQKYKKHNELTIINIKYPASLFLVISTLLACIYIIKLLVDAGVTSSFTGALRRIYEMQSGEGYSPGFIYNQCREVVVAIGYLNVFRLLIRLYSKEDKISIIKLSVPIIIFLILILISTERNLFLRFAIYIVCMWAFIFSYTHKGKNLNFKIIIRATIMLFVVVVTFFLFGVAKQYTSSFFDQVSVYCASGLNNFNLWIKDFNEPLLFGKSTLTTFLGSLGVFLSPFGIESGGSVEQIDPFISYVTNDGYHYLSNIFSALKPYVEDFGYFGVILFPFIIGIFYQWLYSKTKHSKLGLSCIIYAMLIYSVIYFPILEQLFRRFHLGFIYELVWISVLYYFVFGRKSNFAVKKSIPKINGAQNARH